MGAWGPALYSDDLACDIRDDYKMLIGDGLDSEQATAELIQEYEDSIRDRDEKGVFWFALADTQWKTGRLIKSVKEKTLEIIDSESDLERWKNDSKNLKKRRLAIEKLKQQLLTEQPKEKRLPKVYREASKFNVGDVFSYQNGLEKKALFRVINIHQDKGGRFAVCELLNWFSKDLPMTKSLFSKPKVNVKRIANLRVKEIERGTKQFMLGENAAKYQPKDDCFELITSNSKPRRKGSGYAIINWRDLDDRLIQVFGK